MGSDRVVATIQLPTFWNCCNNCVFINVVVVVIVLCGKSSLCVKSKHDCTRHWSWFTYLPPPHFLTLLSQYYSRLVPSITDSRHTHILFSAFLFLLWKTAFEWKNMTNISSLDTDNEWMEWSQPVNQPVSQWAIPPSASRHRQHLAMAVAMIVRLLQTKKKGKCQIHRHTDRERRKTSFHQHSPTCMRIKERAEFLVGDIMVNGKFVK